ncbi:MAG: hypothetical protein ACTSXO_02485 [Candidatus Heimdallarchaeota archaeon]|nr:MAG: hypothetical protein DRP02_03815 [Candidatus Gerdarchaeota archaeon]RLI73088.1 MAG: hypothetical protein DRO91_03670 [Candidatus Heimdallarchaeota archaeon]
MTRNRTQKSNIIVLLLLLIVGLSNIKTQASIVIDFYYGESFAWEIDDISSSNNSWYNISTFAFVTNWHANKSDLISFSVLNSKTINEKQFLFGNLSIGNISLLADNKDIGFNLGLSVNPWYGGLVALEDNWKTLILSHPFNTTNAQIIEEKTINWSGQDVAVIEINYDDGFQKSTLQYEKLTGILMTANTSVGSFWLKMHLTSSTIPIPSPTKTIVISEAFVLVGLAAIVLLRRMHSRR